MLPPRYRRPGVHAPRQPSRGRGTIPAMKRWHLLIGAGVSAVFLYLALRGLHLEQVWAALRGAHYGWLLPGIAVYFVGLYLRAWRWHYLLRPLQAVPTRTLFPIVTIGYMGNNIFPARAGEVLRAVLLRRERGVPISASLATILVERVYDGVVMLGFVFLNLPELARFAGAASGFVGDLRTLALWGSVAFLGALTVFLLAGMFPARAEALLRRLVAPLPARWATPVLNLGTVFLEGLRGLGAPREAWMIFVTSVAIWLLETAKYWFVMHAFAFRVPFFALMLMNGVVNLATTLPSAPGYVGTFDTPGIAVLVAYGVDKAIAAAYTLTLHAALWLPVTALGFFYALQAGLHWRELARPRTLAPTEDAS